MAYPLSRDVVGLLGATLRALNGFVETPGDSARVHALTVALSEQAAHTIHRTDAERPLWVGAYWSTIDALDTLRKAVDHITPEFVSGAVRRDVTRSIRTVEHAAKENGPTPLPTDEHGRYNPAPGTEYPFSVSDIARATVQLLGPDWHAESGFHGTTGDITSPDGDSYHLAVGDVGDVSPEMYVQCGDDQDVLWESGGLSLQTHAQRVAASIRASR